MMINGVVIKELKVFSDDKGKVMHMMKSTDKIFSKFGEIYFSVINPRKIKGWHKNQKATRNYVVVDGNIKLVLYDGNELQEVKVGEKNYCLVQIPPGVWSSFCAIGGKKAIVADLLDTTFDQKDTEKKDPFSLTNYWMDNAP